MKHPSVRTASLQDWLPETLSRVRDIFSHFAILLPFSVVDFEVVGSYAKGTAMFRSELDVCIALEDKRASITEQLRNDISLRQKWSDAKSWLVHTIYEELGLFVQLSFESPAVADDPNKCCYRLFEGAWYHPESISDPRNKPLASHFSFSYTDENEVNRVNEDVYAPILDEWRNKLNGKMLEVGFTPDTSYLYGDR